MSINKTYNGGRPDGLASINHCTALNEGAPLATNVYNIVICVGRADLVYPSRWSGPLYHSITIVTESL
jgi:hypothetical protein